MFGWRSRRLLSMACKRCPAGLVALPTLIHKRTCGAGSKRRCARESVRATHAKCLRRSFRLSPAVTQAQRL